MWGLVFRGLKLAGARMVGPIGRSGTEVKPVVGVVAAYVVADVVG